MQLFLLHYAALFYVIYFYFAWKRWYCTLNTGGGRKAINRLRRCAPQVLVRAAQQQRRCELFLESCIGRRHWLQYGFCYYYGGHARHVSSWLIAAGTLYCLWNNVHAPTPAQCYVFSGMAFAGMAEPHVYGPHMGMILAVTVPAFMRCSICPPHFTDGGCVEFQAAHGCHACDRRGCWRANLSCPFFLRSRDEHRDAGWGDSIPHMRETHITCVADGSNIGGRRSQQWWRQFHDVRFIVDETEHFVMGTASGDECNCLIDTLRQQLNLDCDPRAVRAFVQTRHATLVHGEYLELQIHWRDVILGLAHVAGRDIVPGSYKIVCLDAMFIGNGDVEGTGAISLYIARQNANHFVPLLRPDTFDSDDDISGSRSASNKSSCDEADPNPTEDKPDEPPPDDLSAGNTETAAIVAKSFASLQSLAADASSKSERHGFTEVDSDVSSAPSQDEASNDEASSAAYDSDATDLFHLEVEPAATWETPQDKDRRVAHVLAAQMRRHPLVPPQPDDEAASTSFIAVQSGLKLPAAHCAFRGCCWTGSTKGSIEEHVVQQHRAQLLAAEEEVFGKGTQYGSSPKLSKLHYSLNMYSYNQPLRHFFMGYYRQAIAEIERGAVLIAEQNHAKEMPHGLSACQGVPIVGPSVDRRTFGHLREVYNDKDICSLICFVCAQRRTHTKHPNSLIQRRYLELFKPDHTERALNEVLRIHTPQQFLKNLCRKTFLHRFARQGTPLWKADFLGPTEDSAVVTKNIILPQEDQADSDIAWEWRRLYLAADGGVWDLLCCPEDVTPPFGIYFKLMCPHGPSINGIIHGTHMLVYAISYTTYTL